MSKITPEVVQAVRDAVDVVDIAGQLTTLKRQGRKYQGLCPFHKEKTPSFQVDPDLGLYHCFGCGAGGDAIKLHMESSGDDFRGAIESLAQRYGIPLPEGDDRGGAPPLDVTSALEEAQGFFTRHLSKNQLAKDYLDRRLISEALRQQYGLGYAPDGWQILLDALRRRIDTKLLVASGLVGVSEKNQRSYDRFRHRLMFPIHSPTGRLVGFGGRTLGDDRAKYVNTAETRAFKKGELLYGLHQAKRAMRDSGRAVLVEGYFDVLGMVASGVPEAVAGMGTSLTEQQARLLARFVDRVVLAYDGDAAGDKAVARALPVLLGAGLAVQRAAFPAGHDPDSLRLESGPESVRSLVEEAGDAMLQAIERLASGGPLDPAAQAKAAGEMRELLDAVRHPVTRSGYARKGAQKLGIDEEILLRSGGASLFGQGIQLAQGSEQSGERGENWSGERRALQLLLVAERMIPLPEDLPSEDAFLVPVHRRIMETFLELYRREQRPPSARQVRDALVDDEEATRELADLLLDEAPDDDELPRALAALEKRWVRRRLQQIQIEIRAASETGDAEEIDRLLAEKARLARRRHPSMSGRFW
ncbi:MAG: DNA primase [Acidobacteriota bacterium]